MVIDKATIALASAIISGVGTVYAGMQAKKQANREAEALKKEAEQKARARIKEGQRLASRQRALFAKSGVVVDADTPLLVVEETLSDAEEDARQLRENYATRASIRRSEGRSAFNAGLIGGAAQIGSGIGNYQPSTPATPAPGGSS